MRNTFLCLIGGASLLALAGCTPPGTPTTSNPGTTLANIGSDMVKVATTVQLGTAVLDAVDGSALPQNLTDDITKACNALTAAGTSLATATSASGSQASQDVQTALNAAKALEAAYATAYPANASKAAAYLAAVSAAVALYNAEAPALGLAPVIG